MIPESQWRWFGNAAHFIGGQDCRFHMATLIGKFLVSTVGQYRPDSRVREVLASARGGDRDAYEQIGFNRTFETMVFKAGAVCESEGCGCGLPSLDPPSELAFGGYDTAGDATRGHMELCYQVAGWEGQDTPEFVTVGTPMEWRDRKFVIPGAFVEDAEL